MWKIAASVLCLATLTACVPDATVRVSSDQLVGRYYSGDGLGRMVWVDLEPDGSYTAEWEGCLGVYGGSRGAWQAEGDQVVFNPREESGNLSGHLSTATTIRHRGELGFVRTQDVQAKQVHETLVFLKQGAQR